MSRRHSAGILAITLITLLSACVRPVREELILLSSEIVPIAPSHGQVATVSLGRITVPEYLDGYDIVSRISPHELKRDDSSRWAERLPDATARVIRAGLVANGVKVVDGAANVLSVDIAAFEATPDGVVVLSASWEVFAGKRQLLGRGGDVIEQPAKAGAPGQAAAMERALHLLAGRIAETINGLPDASAVPND